MNKLLSTLAFAAGLGVLVWIGAGYLPSQPLALAVTAVIAGFYLIGAIECWRGERMVRDLERSLDALRATPADLDAWLAELPAVLRSPVRNRLDGARQDLPGPLLAPYLTGLLVLLGMLGTFLGMVVTLAGTGAALSGAGGLSAIRDALSAPVRGLGLAFGTSVAGVAASAMLGLMLAMARRERARAAQRLDTAVATTLRPFSGAHQRESSLHLLERQAGALPALVDRLDACMTAIERRQQALAERLADDQAGFHAQTAQRFADLAATVERVLVRSASDSAQHAQTVIEPAVERVLAGLARQGGDLQAGLAAQVRAQLDGVAERFDGATAAMTERWSAALADQQRQLSAGTELLGTALRRLTDEAAGQAATMADGLARQVGTQFDALIARSGERFDQLIGRSGEHFETLIARSGAQFDALGERLGAQLGDLGERLGEQSAALGERLTARWDDAAERQRAAAEHSAGRHEQSLRAMADELGRQAAALVDAAAAAQSDLRERLAEQEQARFANWTRSLDGIATTLDQRWRDAGEAAAQRWQQIGEAMRVAQADVAERTDVQARGLIEALEQRAQADQARIEAATRTLTTLAESLQTQWRAADTESDVRWRQAGETLRQTAAAITEGLRAQADATLAEIGRLVEAASAAPRAAADVIAELRQKLADSLVHDNAMIDERNRLLGTVAQLLDTVNHAAGEQRSAIDALVAASSDLLTRSHAQFADALRAPQAAIETAAVQVAGGAVEVASLGEAFGGAVRLFGESNERLMSQLERIESALGASLARSDEQLDYYVAQAREVIELSIGAQKQIIDELRQVAASRAGEADADRVDQG